MTKINLAHLLTMMVFVGAGFFVGTLYTHRSVAVVLAALSGFSFSFFMLSIFFVSIKLKMEAQTRKEMDEVHKIVNKWMNGELKKSSISITRFIEDFFDGSPIQNHVVHFSADGMEISVGSDDYMVSVDSKLFKKDPVIALERARMAWMADVSS